MSGLDLELGDGDLEPIDEFKKLLFLFWHRRAARIKLECLSLTSFLCWWGRSIPEWSTPTVPPLHG